jgi:hypothetical protein
MTGDKPLFEKQNRSALTEGAARFDSLARELKTQQIALTKGLPAGEQPPVAVPSPDEAWNRNFMSQAIGPRFDLPPIVPVMQAPPMPNISIELPQARSVAPAAEIALREPVGPLREQIGKPQQRRSWLGRLLRPKSQDAE